MSFKGSATLTAAPANGSSVEFTYPITPSDTTALHTASEAVITITSTAPGSSITSTYVANTSLRNLQ